MSQDKLLYYGLVYLIENNIQVDEFNELDKNMQQFVEVMKTNSSLECRIDAIIKAKQSLFITYKKLLYIFPQYFYEKVIDAQWQEGLEFIINNSEIDFKYLVDMVLQKNWDNGIKIIVQNNKTFNFVKKYIKFTVCEPNIFPYIPKKICGVKEKGCNDVVMIDKRCDLCDNIHISPDGREYLCLKHLNEKSNHVNMEILTTIRKECKECCIEHFLEENCQISICPSHINNLSKLYCNINSYYKPVNIKSYIESNYKDKQECVFCNISKEKFGDIPEEVFASYPYEIACLKHIKKENTRYFLSPPNLCNICKEMV